VRQRKASFGAVPNRHSGCTGGSAHRWAGLLSKPRAEGSNSNRKPRCDNDLTLLTALPRKTETAFPCHLGSDFGRSSITAPNSPLVAQLPSRVPTPSCSLQAGRSQPKKVAKTCWAGHRGAFEGEAAAVAATGRRSVCQNVAPPAKTRQVSRCKVATTRASNDSRAAKVHIRGKLIHERLTQR
jgi:hypothetical protein